MYQISMSIHPIALKKFHQKTQKYPLAGEAKGKASGFIIRVIGIHPLNTRLKKM